MLNQHPTSNFQHPTSKSRQPLRGFMSENMQADGSFATGVENCARCGYNHFSVVFFALKNAPVDTSHYGLCPMTGQPILMKVADDSLREQKENYE